MITMSEFLSVTSQLKSSYIVDMFIWRKSGNFSVSMKEGMLTSIL